MEAVVKKDVFYSLTLIKHNIKIRNQRERKLSFLSHLFFSLIVIVIIIFSCYHDYYNYQIVYHHHVNYYFCLHLHPFVECPNVTFKNSWYIISVYGWFWHWNRDDCKMNANLSYPDKSRGSFEGHKSLHLSMSPKFLIYVILWAQHPNSITSFTRKECPNSVIGARYPNVMMWLVRDTWPNAATKLVWDTYQNSDNLISFYTRT